MKLALLVAAVLGGCTVGPDGSGGGGDDQQATPDAPGTPSQDAPTSNLCPLPAATADTGALTALKAQRCNVSGSMGTRQWYRLSASLPGSPTDIVQLELWDGQGAFTGRKVALGTYPITGAELSYTTCGVCVRAVGDKGAAGTKLYMATGGSVQVTAIGINGAPIAATLNSVTFGEVTPTMTAVAGGCGATVAKTAINGTVMDVGIGGGGGGGGGGGANQCPTTVGD